MDRSTGLGGSEVAALLGWSPWGTALDVYERKLGILPELETSERMRWGQLLERSIADGYAERIGCVVHHNSQMLRHPEHPWMTGTPDGFAFTEGMQNPKRVVAHWAHAHGQLHLPEAAWGYDIKNSGWLNREEYGTEGTDAMPHHYKAQLAWYGMLTGIERWDLVVLEKGNKLRIWRYLRDQALEQEMFEAARTFWHDHVQLQQPPGAEWPAVQPRWHPPTDLSGNYRSASSRHMALRTEWERLEGLLKRGTDRIDGIKMELMKDTGTDSGIAGVCSMKWHNGIRKPKWKQVAESLMSHVDPKEVRTIVNHHGEVGDPTLRITRWKDKT